MCIVNSSTTYLINFKRKKYIIGQQTLAEQKRKKAGARGNGPITVLL